MTKRALSPPEAILFDIGDTLFDTRVIADDALAETARWLERRSPAIDRDAFLGAYRRADAAQRGLEFNHLWGLPVAIMVEACAAAGLPRAVALLANAFYRDRVRRRIAPNEAVVGLFRRLAGDGIALGVVSNGTTIEQLDTLALLALLDHVQVAAISQDLQAEKPDPGPFEWALAQLGVEARRTWFVGNDPQADYGAAERLGMSAILVGEEGDGDYRRVAAPEDVGRLLDAARGS